SAAPTAAPSHVRSSRADAIAWSGWAVSHSADTGIGTAPIVAEPTSAPASTSTATIGSQLRDRPGVAPRPDPEVWGSGSATRMSATVIGGRSLLQRVGNLGQEVLDDDRDRERGRVGERQSQLLVG